MQERKIRYLISTFLKEVLLPQQPASSDPESQEQPLNENATSEIEDSGELITETVSESTLVQDQSTGSLNEESYLAQAKKEEASEIREAEDLMEKEVEVVKEDSAESGVIDEVISEDVGQDEKPVIFKKWNGLMERMKKRD